MSQRVCPIWIGYLLASPIRKLMQNPRTILAPYVREGMQVLDFGSAMGFFSIPMAQMVGPAGKVICVDMQERMLRRLEKRARKAGVAGRIETRLCPQNEPDLKALSGTLDFALVWYVVHEVPYPAALFAELFSAIKPSASVLLGEPTGHVEKEDFASTLLAAQQQGFSVADTPRISRTYTALLKKESR
ncbi:MAG TPA: class I SAM-dependent methyltransferase [Methylomirabilota bacterium]|nr:class I SAM-dependent methyltransferase [Methylomirabilota bacterium]